MKERKNQIILFFFLICFLLRNSIDYLFIEHLVNPEIDETLSIENQNLKTELNDLKKEIGLEKENNQKIYSRLEFRDGYHFFDTITILKGKKDRITENMAVVQGKNLLGITENVMDHHSGVKLLTNKDTVLSIKVKDSYGIMKTNDKKECWIENLSKNVKLEIGNTITTSGLTEIPANIVVGTVEEIELNELGLIWKVKVTLKADFQNINYVTLLKKEVQNE